jgi:hypothetical protein
MEKSELLVGDKSNSVGVASNPIAVSIDAGPLTLLSPANANEKVPPTIFAAVRGPIVPSVMIDPEIVSVPFPTPVLSLAG